MQGFSWAVVGCYRVSEGSGLTVLWGFPYGVSFACVGFERGGLSVLGVTC